MNQVKKFNVRFERREVESSDLSVTHEDLYENTDSPKYRKREWAPPKCEQKTFCHVPT
jgi:hypothetical protein